MDLVIIMLIPYIIVLVLQIFYKKKHLKNGKKTDNIEHLVIVVFGNSTLAYVCSNSDFTDIMRTTIIGIFTVLYVIFWVVCLGIDNKKN
ncbi:hypothetical protein [Clostridium sp. UBA5988]|uniref:hypothetical protein n=1 Tax=Clostridium sp. UBA5988 TaxID=1946369 RepID=UPI003217CAEA